MSETMREAIPIIFMFGCVLLLGPFIGFAMWMMYDGDRAYTDEPAKEQAVTTVELPSVHGTAALVDRGAPSAA